MFNVMSYAFIDSVQNLKKNAINMCVYNEDVNTALNTFVNTQTEYTKAIVENTNTAYVTICELMFGKSYYSDALKSTMSK